MKDGRKNRALTPISSNKGFTLLALLMVVAVMGAGLAAYGELASHALQREKERDLIFAGQQYRQAIAAYYEHTPGVVKRYPKRLEDLLADSRFPNVQRYLRKLYADPITGSAQWGLMEAPGGGIMGVYSLSEAAPIKTGGFAPGDASFVGAASYSAWKFFHAPQSVPAAAGSPTGLRRNR